MQITALLLLLSLIYISVTIAAALPTPGGKKDEKPKTPGNPIGEAIDVFKNLAEEKKERKEAWDKALDSGDAVVIRRRPASSPRFPKPHLEYQSKEEWKQNEGKKNIQKTDGKKRPKVEDVRNTWPPKRQEKSTG